MQEVHISKSVKLIDSPGVVAVTSNPAAVMALRSLQVEEGQENVLEAAMALLKQCDKTQVRKAAIVRAEAGLPQRSISLIFSGRLPLMFQIMLQYNVADFRNSLEFLTLLAKKRGYLQKGGVANTEQAAACFLADCTG